MNTKKLKQLVLDLAIHGKLVPQDPNDEPASELLKRIQADVETHGRASNKSKGKKSAVSSVDLDEVPFEVPEGWCWTRLGDCFFMQAGKNVKAEDISEEQTECAQYRCFGGNGLRGYVNSYNHNGRFPIIGRQGALCGNVNFAEGEFYATEHAVPVHTFAGTDPMWAYHFLKVLNLNQYATATAQPGLSVKVIEEVLIPLPPLAEQHRIVAAIEKWFAVIDQLEKNEADLKKSIEQTKKKVLDLAIRGKLVAQNPEDEPAGKSIKAINPKAEILFESDEYGEVPEGWCLVSVGDLNEYKSGGINPLDNKDTIYELYSVPIYSSGYPEISKGKDIGSTKQKVEKDDVLLCKINPHLNRVWVVSHHKKELQCLASSEWVVLRSSITSPEYLKYALSSEYFRLLLNSNVSGVGGSLTRAQPMFIKKYLIPLPPLAEQKRIVEKIEEVMGVLERIEGMVKS